MKFLCDRCKTRYSIGDDRVRGKILKIRCKNCANVITVREGMSDGADAADLGPRKRSTTTAAPEVIAPPTPATGPVKPPAALEEEWYVSIDGDQEGPFSLVDAQQWVGAKDIDADLHCWSEGFDDWLPVDKVSHFRGLRKAHAAPPPPPPAPPPVPRGAPSLRVGAAAVEAEPKPLFAATMASLEKSGPVATNLPPPRPSATPARGVQTPPPAQAQGQVKTNGTAKPAPQPGVTPGKQPRAETAPAKSSFDTNDQPTQIEAAPFADSKPVARPRVDPFAAPAAPDPRSVEPDAPDARDTSTDDDDDDGLAIGEVSRVVKLADLMAAAKPRAAAAAPQRRSSPMIANATGGVPRVSATGLVMRVDDPALAAEAAIAGAAQAAATEAPVDPALAPATSAASSRRGLYLLIGVAGVLMAGVIVAVIVLVGGSTTSISTLGKTKEFDTVRPDDPLGRTGGAGVASGPGSAVANPYLPPKTPTTTTRPTRPTNTNVPLTPDNPTSGDRIGGEEVEAMARTQSSTTQRCYMRAQRGADAITIGDVKKINVTIEIAADGTTRTVTLDSNSTNTLGKCLIGAIKAWKFRVSPGGTYRFALVFQGA